MLLPIFINTTDFATNKYFPLRAAPPLELTTLQAIAKLHGSQGVGARFVAPALTAAQGRSYENVQLAGLSPKERDDLRRMGGSAEPRASVTRVRARASAAGAGRRAEGHAAQDVLLVHGLGASCDTR